jgi:E3 ubiquitin-protein ligase NEDD4
MVERVRDQLAALVEGFRELVPHSVLDSLKWTEFDMMLNGTQELDLNDWRTHTTYTGSLNEQSEIVTVFWTIVSNMDNEQKSNLLRYVTGSDRLPVGGFASLHGNNGPCKFTITSLDDRFGGLPSAHTCFNRLELPYYENVQDLERMLALAIRESAERFELE